MIITYSKEYTEAEEQVRCKIRSALFVILSQECPDTFLDVISVDKHWNEIIEQATKTMMYWKRIRKVGIPEKKECQQFCKDCHLKKCPKEDFNEAKKDNKAGRKMR